MQSIETSYTYLRNNHSFKDDMSLVNIASNPKQKNRQISYHEKQSPINSLNQIGKSVNENIFLNVLPSKLPNPQKQEHCLIDILNRDPKIELILTHEQLFQLNDEHKMVLIPMDIMLDLLKSFNFNNESLIKQAKQIRQIVRSQMVAHSYEN